ncbi:MAG: hypothetical protein ACLQOO_17080 [Terriglobia bacterium]
MSEVVDRSPEKDSKHSLLDWARRHPAATALGVVVFAGLCLLPFSPKRPLADQPSAEQFSDESPLFI